MATLQTAKKELRKRIKEGLKTLTSDNVAKQTNQALTTFLSLPEYKAAQKVSVYLSMPSGEISTDSIVKDALKAGKKVFIPYYYKMQNEVAGQPASIMDMLHLQSLSDYEGLKPDKWGIPTPAEESLGERGNSFGRKGKSEGDVGEGGEDGGLDLIIMPGMAFDETFGRLGHGKGFYDFFLERCRQQCQKNQTKMPFLVGLALKEQLLPSNESVPMGDTDWRLDALITGDGKLLRRNR